MHKTFKKVIISIFSIIFAFSPIVFTGCNLWDEDDPQYNPNNYKVSDYLSAIKTSYTVNVDPQTTHGQMRTYAQEALAVSELMSMDIIVNLLQQYGVSRNTTFDIASSTDAKFTKTFEASTIPFDTACTFELTNDYGSIITFNYKQTNSYKDTIHHNNWLFYNNSAIRTPNDFDEYLEYLYMIGTNKSNLYKFSYAILLISDMFSGITEDLFDTTYTNFKADYDRQTNYQQAAKNLSFNIKHSGLTGTMEIKALKQYILDYVIGTEAVQEDQNHYFVRNDSTDGYELNPSVEFEGENYYFYHGTSVPKNDVSLYINDFMIPSPEADGESSRVQTRLLEVYKQTNVKLWQDLDNDGKVDIPVVPHRVDKEIKLPKFRTDKEFRNYKYTVSFIVNDVVSSTNKLIHESRTIYGYPVVSNVFMVDYSYQEAEVSTLRGEEYSCKLPRRAYKGFVLCTKDRSLEEVKNSLGSIYLLMESAKGDEIKIDLFARYYRSGVGYATWGEDNQTFYPLTKETQTINGPYSFKMGDNGKFDEGCLLTLEFTDLFKNAKFENESNNKTFTYTYTNEKGDFTKTVELYELERFPENYYDLSTKVEDRVKHATIFALGSKDNQYYETIEINGKKLYCYSEKNLEHESNFGFVEILFHTSNEKYFSFGFTGYVPASEEISEYSS